MGWGTGGGVSAASVGWVAAGGTVELLTATDGVGIGLAPAATDKLVVLGDATRHSIRLVPNAAGQLQLGSTNIPVGICVSGQATYALYVQGASTTKHVRVIGGQLPGIGPGGNLDFWAGDGGITSGAGGTVWVAAGDANGAANDNGGNVDVTPGAAVGTGTEGAIRHLGRAEDQQGADAASANDLTLGLGNYFDVTGATQINAIRSRGWQAGSLVTLQFDSTPTVKHNTAGGAGFASLILATAADFFPVAGSTLTLRYDGATWREVSRMLATVTLVTALTGNTAIAAASSREAFTNEGAVALRTHTLPAAVAGLGYTFIIQDSDGMAIQAAAGDTIRFAAEVSSAAGTATATIVGSVITILCINATEWIVTSAVGSWTLA